MARRERGEGSFYQRRDGMWIGAVVVGQKRVVQKDGTVVMRPEVRTVSSKVRAIAHARYEDLKRRHGAGVVLPERATVAQLLERYRAHKELTLEQGGRGYEAIELSIRAHLIPHLGDVRLLKLTPAMVERMMAAIAADGRKRTALVARSTLRAAWNWGRGERILSGDNPAEDADVEWLKYAPRARGTFSVAHAKAVMAADHPLQAYWTLGFATGMRMSEMLRLVWEDVDLDAGRCYVRGTKTRASVATVLLAPFAVDALRAHRRATGRIGGLVWVTRSGTAHLRSNVHKYWARLLDELDIPYLNFHSATRHTFVTLLRRERVDAEIVQSVVRHARISTTMDVYSHLDVDDQQPAAAAIQRLLGD